MCIRDSLYTILFILCFGIGYGAYYATADMPIPMVADCSDYETYRSGKYIPGIMGTMFSLVDKLVSSLAQTLVAFIFLLCAGMSELPTDSTPYSVGIKVAVIIMFCVIPMLAWIATLVAMKGYSLTGEKMKEIQAVNGARKKAIASGMTLEPVSYTHLDVYKRQVHQGSGKPVQLAVTVSGEKVRVRQSRLPFSGPMVFSLSELNQDT